MTEQQQYTPTTEQVRSHYVFNQSDRWDPPRGEAFDRWLAKVRAEARAEAIAEFEWEYVPGHIDRQGREFVQSGVIAPWYVAQYIADGGEALRRRVGKFETYKGGSNA